MIETIATDQEQNVLYRDSSETLLEAQIKASNHFIELYGGPFPVSSSRIDVDEHGMDRAYYLIEDEYQRVEVHMRFHECVVLPFKRR